MGLNWLGPYDGFEFVIFEKSLIQILGVTFNVGLLKNWVFNFFVLEQKHLTKENAWILPTEILVWTINQNLWYRFDNNFELSSWISAYYSS